MEEPVEETWVRLRFRDLDGFGHVYHAEYLTLLDEARTRWFDTVGIDEPAGYVVVHMEIDWVSPLGPGDTAVRAAFEVEAVGTSSVTLRETLYADDGRAVATSRSVTVRWQRDTGRSRPLTTAERAALER